MKFDRNAGRPVWADEATIAIARAAGLSEEPGYVGFFTRETAPGALPSGTRIRKVMSDPTDKHAVGSLGTVLGSLYQPVMGVAYFIEWDAHPKHAVLAVARKVEQEK